MVEAERICPKQYFRKKSLPIVEGIVSSSQLGNLPTLLRKWFAFHSFWDSQNATWIAASGILWGSGEKTMGWSLISFFPGQFRRYVFPPATSLFPWTWKSIVNCPFDPFITRVLSMTV